MKTLKILIYSVLLCCVTLCLSCVKDTDFNQTENILPTPVFESDLVFSTLEALNFIDDTTQQEVEILSDTTRLEFINSDFFVNQLAQTEITFRFTNSLNRDFIVYFEFVTDNNELRYLAQVDVPAGQTESPIIAQSSFLIEEPELSSFKEATKLIYKITLPATATATANPINPSTLGALKLESKATFYFEL